jgi:hypothetical protein
MFLGMLAFLPLLALTGCGGAGAMVSSTAATSYTEPLASTASPSSADALIGWPGAAGQVVHCAGPVIGTTRAAPYDGEDAAATPDAALAAAKKWGLWSGVQQGFTLARTETGRRLYVFEVGGVAKQALILRHGPALKGDGTRNTVTRWWLESWARCDYAELPDAVARDRKLQIWSDTDGKRQLTSTIVSFDYSGVCFPGMTALDIDGPPADGWNKGKQRPVEYVRNPAPQLRDEYFAGSYEQKVVVPANAVDSGYERDGEHLWFSKDRDYAYIGTQNDADAWPRAKQQIRCA